MLLHETQTDTKVPQSLLITKAVHKKEFKHKNMRWEAEISISMEKLL